jgi:hypothetical protein
LSANSQSKGNWLQVKVAPNASRNEITGFIDGVLQVKIAAPPVKGKANKELANFLGRALGVKKSTVSIVKGQTARNKVIAIEGLSRDEIMRRLKV